MIHRKKNDLLYKTPHICVITTAGRVNSIKSNTGRKQAQDSPGILHYFFVGGVKFPLFGFVCFVCLFFVCFVLFGGGGDKTTHICVAGSLMCC